MRFELSPQLRTAARRTRFGLLAIRRQWRGALARSHHQDLPPRLVMTLLVRDEADIVAATIEHALGSGVDFVIATDNGSVDGTVEILEAYRRAGVLELIHEPDHTYEQGRWVTRMARRAALEHGANWVLNADADEFVFPADGDNIVSLPALLARVGPQFGLVGLNPRHFSIDPRASGGWLQRAVLRDAKDPERHRISGVWKVAHRADPRVLVEQGNHLADGPRIGPLASRPPLVVLHYPDRGYAQYERKIRNGGSSYVANTRLAQTSGLYWRRDYAQLMAGEFAASYAARQLSIETAEACLASGQLVRDTTLSDRLVSLVDRAVRPDLLRAVLQQS